MHKHNTEICVSRIPKTTIVIVKKSMDNDECWYNNCIGQSFVIKEKTKFTGVHKDSVIVRAPSGNDGWVWAGDYVVCENMDTKKKSKGLTYFSLFSGIGGFEVGIQKAIPYAKCVGFSEIDPYAKSIYQKHFKNHRDYGDVTKINENELPEFDCLVGGFPCQPFSLSGERKGFKDTRGTLFFDIVRILEAKRPKVLVLENVRGLLSHDKGRTFGTIVKTLDELRYDIQWQVLNCKHHGTPQDRNRVFIVGYSRTCGQSAKKILPIRYSSEKTTKLSRQQAVFNTLRRQHADGSRQGSYIIEGRKSQVIENLNPTAFHSERIYKSKPSPINKMGGTLGILKRKDGICYALTKTHANHVIQLTQFGLTQGARVYDPFGIGITLNSKGGGMGANTGLYCIKERVRRLMPIECERLQDFPDNWCKFNKKDGRGISDNQKYACIGNAVNTKVIGVIFDKLRRTLTNKKTQKKILTPRVVSFSGGRTSAMMLLQLLEKEGLHQWRGDCVVFNNTSAEHSATYAFVVRIKKLIEEKYNIPFFMIEFQTYEIKTSRGYVRRPTYRLVKNTPFCRDSNPDGYKSNGDVFEECISQTGVLPSTFQRTCTINMKIEATNLFLQDWFACKLGNDLLGQVTERSNITDADIIAKHRRYNGELSDDAIVAKKRFVIESKAFRSKQLFQDFTVADIIYNNSYLKSKIVGNRVSLFGRNAVHYNNYIGIRYDEKHRAIKIRNRIKEAKLNLNRKAKNKKGGTIKNQPPFEQAKMPMIKAKIDKAKVIDFWQNSSSWSKYDLDLPYDGLLSNCVHCMLKGKTKNQLIAATTIAIDNIDTSSPESLQWWANIEKKYSRKVIKNSSNNYTNIGFFGASKGYVYQTWMDELIQNNHHDNLLESCKNDSWTMDCNCTD